MFANDTFQILAGSAALLMMVGPLIAGFVFIARRNKNAAAACGLISAGVVGLHLLYFAAKLLAWEFGFRW